MTQNCKHIMITLLLNWKEKLEGLFDLKEESHASQKNPAFYLEFFEKLLKDSFSCLPPFFLDSN